MYSVYDPSPDHQLVNDARLCRRSGGREGRPPGSVRGYQMIKGGWGRRSARGRRKMYKAITRFELIPASEKNAALPIMLNCLYCYLPHSIIR